MTFSRSSSTHTTEDRDGETSRESDISTPPSPTTTMTSTHSDDGITEPAQNVNDSLDDIFGSSPPAAPSQLSGDHGFQPAPTVAAEPSDLPSIRRQHVTSGYRDGITVSKGANVQRGFDAGFPVGGNLGLRAGILLGVLEGIVAVGQQTGKNGANNGQAGDLKQKAEEVYRAAKKELTVSGVFGGLDQSQNRDEDPVEQLGSEGERVLNLWEERVRVLVAGEQS